MDGLLFDPIEYTDPGIRAVMDGKTCRQCGHRLRACWGHASYCEARKSNRTLNGLLKIKANQPACILFTPKDNEQ